MRRNLAFVITLAAAAAAQTPTVVEKPATKAANVKVAAAAASSKPSPATLKSVAAHPAVVSVAPRAGQSSSAPAVKPASTQTGAARVSVSAAKPETVAASAKPAAAPVAAKAKFASVPAQKAPKAAPVTLAAKPNNAKVVTKSEVQPRAVALGDDQAASKDKKPAQEVHMTGRRDPFISPIVSMGAMGSGCSSGKRCLAIDQIVLRGVVKSDSGRIAVVVNAMDKAYFLRENDPVFNGYVLKITGDSIVFKETFHDRLGKPLTRDVTKTITRPAV